MNNHSNYPKNLNYYNNMFNTNVPKGIQNPQLQSNTYEPYEGFIKGNLFPSLYDPYRNQQPYQIQPMNEQAKMLTNIDALGFAMTDLNLYLDINPNDQNAINLFNQYRVQKEDLLKTYQNNYGPLLLNSDILTTIPWAWDNQPWPWEN